MPRRLSIEEARSLVQVFGPLDRDESIILFLLQEPGTIYDALTRNKRFPKAYRVSQATFYRKAKVLIEDHFLEVVDEARRKGPAGLTVESYRPTLKGMFAAVMAAYTMFLEAEPSKSIMDEIHPEKLIEIPESQREWGLYIDFLTWQKEHGINLRHADVDVSYFISAMVGSIIVRPESLTQETLQDSFKDLKERGIIQRDVDAKEVLPLVRSARSAFQRLQQKLLPPPQAVDSRSKVEGKP
jgi:hypothetical protein